MPDCIHGLFDAVDYNKNRDQQQKGADYSESGKVGAIDIGENLSSTARSLREICRFLFIFFTEFKRDRINLRAAALTYSVVLSLVPMLALSTAVLKGMGAGDQMQQAAYQLIENLSGSARTIPDQALSPTKPADRVAKKTEPYVAENSTKAVSPSLDNDTVSPKKDFSGYLYEAVDKIC